MTRPTEVRYFFIIVICFLSIIPLTATDEFFHITTDDGLSQANVTCILLDKEGFLWLGTRKGLNKYDGTQITNFFHNEADSTSIGFDDIKQIIETPNKQIIIATANCILSIYDKKVNKFKNICLSKDLVTGSAQGQLVSMCLEKDSILWVANSLRGIFSIHLKNFKTKTYLEGIPTMAIAIDFKGDIWAATKTHNCILKYNRKQKSFEATEVTIPQKAAQHSRKVRCLFGDSNSNLWVGTDGGGLVKYNINAHELKLITAEDGTLPNNVIYTIDEDNYGNIWLGHENSGITVLTSRGKVIKYIKANKANPMGLNDNSIYDIYCAANGDKFIGTYSGGVNISFNKRSRFKSYHHIWNSDNCIGEHNVRAFSEAPDGKIWIGTDGGGIKVFNPETEIFEKEYTTKNSSLTSDNITSILFNKQGDAWIGTWRGGLLKYNSNHGIFTPANKIKEEPINILSDHAWGILEDSRNDLWVGEYYYGLLYHKKGVKSTHYPAKPNSAKALEHHAVKVILEDNDNDVWVGTSRGLSKFDRKRESFSHYLHDPNDPGSINNNYIHSLTLDTDNNLWIGTGNGLCRYIKECDCFELFSSKEYFGGGEVLGILPDDQKNLWITTPNYLCCFTPTNNTVKYFDYQSKYAANFKDKKGRMYFNTKNGFISFHPQNILIEDTPPTVVFTNFLIYANEVPIKEGSILTKHINYVNELSLSYKVKVFSIEFAALNLYNSYKNNYRYRLLGFENEWKEIGSERLATYTNLPPGKYTFQVQASNNEKLWNFEGRSLNINIEPPIYKKIWFVSLVTLVIGLLLALTIKYRERILKKENKILEEHINSRSKIILEQNEVLRRVNQQLADNTLQLTQHQNELDELVEKRTKELEEAKHRAEDSDRRKTAFLSNMSQKICSPLKSILEFTDQLSDGEISQTERLRFLKLVESNSLQLLYIINNIPELSGTETEFMDIEIDIHPVKDTLTNIVDYFKRINTNADVQISANIPTTSYNIFIRTDIGKFNQILTNLISNALKFTKKGYIEVGYKLKSKKELIFYVKDTGIGIKEKNYTKIFERFWQYDKELIFGQTGTGLGLTITKTLCETLSGTIWFESKENKGSTFYFTQPLSKLTSAVEMESVLPSSNHDQKPLT